MNHLRIEIIDEHSDNSAERLGITFERSQELRQRMFDLSKKHCKEPCTGICGLYAVQELATELKHVNEMFFVAEVYGTAVTMQKIQNDPVGVFVTIQRKNEENKGGG